MSRTPSDEDRDPDGTISGWKALVIILAFAATGAVALPELTRFMSTEGAELDLLRVLPALAVGIATAVFRLGPTGALRHLAETLAWSIAMALCTLMVMWITGLVFWIALPMAMVIGAIVFFVVGRGWKGPR